jgi:hypothetical protein
MFMKDCAINALIFMGAVIQMGTLLIIDIAMRGFDHE